MTLTPERKTVNEYSESGMVRLIVDTIDPRVDNDPLRGEYGGHGFAGCVALTARNADSLCGWILGTTANRRYAPAARIF